MWTMLAAARKETFGTAAALAPCGRSVDERIDHSHNRSRRRRRLRTGWHAGNAPQLSFTYSGTGIGRHVYAQLVDPTTGLVLGNQVTPIPVSLDRQTHTITIPMEQIAHTLTPGQTVTLQLVASAVPFGTFWSRGMLRVSEIQVPLGAVTATVKVRL